MPVTESSESCHRIHGIIKDWEVPLPPLGEQLEIVRRIKSMFALAEQLDARLGKTTARVERITQSILANAFRGELDAHATAEHVTQLARLESIPKKSISLGSASLEDA